MQTLGAFRPPATDDASLLAGLASRDDSLGAIGVDHGPAEDTDARLVTSTGPRTALRAAIDWRC